MTQHIRNSEELQRISDIILAEFKSTRLPALIVNALFPHDKTIPSAGLSFINRILMFSAGTIDARNSRQWREAGHELIKGRQPFYIHQPLFEKQPKKDPSGNTVEVVDTLIGFKALPLYRREDTQGRSLSVCPNPVIKFPLAEKAKKCGVTIPSDFIQTQGEAAYSSSSKPRSLLSSDCYRFFQLISNAAYRTYKEQRSSNIDPYLSGITVDLCVHTLARIIRRKVVPLTSIQYQKIERYAERIGVIGSTSHQACYKALNVAEGTLKIILDI